jgi:hypothetical protein
VTALTSVSVPLLALSLLVAVLAARRTAPAPA